MDPNLPTDQKLVPISEAADILGVSIDTIRRWDKNGNLHSQRPDGKNRYFSLEELEKVKFSQPLSISEVSEKLGISPTTLRRLETKGLINPERNSNGERVYTEKALKAFIESEYWLRQIKQEKEILEPFEKTVAEPTPETKAPGPLADGHLIEGLLAKQQNEIRNIILIRRSIFTSIVFLISFSLLTTLIITVSFLLFPERTADFFGYSIQKSEVTLSQVLGSSHPPKNESANTSNLLAKIFRPFSEASLTLVERISPETYKKIRPPKIKDINDIFTVDINGNIYPSSALIFKDISQIKIQTPEGDLSNLINNIPTSQPQAGPISEITFQDRSITGTAIALNTLDFSNFNHSMSLDDSKVISTGLETLSFRGNLNFNSATIDTITLSNPLNCSSCITLLNLGSNSVNSSKIVDGSLIGADLTSNTLDFSEFKDSLALDAATVISNSGNTFAFRGSAGYVFDSATISNLNVTSCTGCGGSVTADSLDFTDFKDSLALDSNTVLNNSSFTLSFRGAQNYEFDSASISTIAIANQLVGTSIVNSGNIVDGTIVGNDISSDSLNFTAMADSLTLDANSVISNSSFTLSFRGGQNYVFDSVSINTLSVTNCTGCAGGGVGVDSLDFTDFKDSLVLDDHAILSSSSFTLSFRGANAVVFDSASIATLTITNNLIGTNVIDSTNIDDGSITSTDILDGTILAADISSDSLNFTQLADSLTLDANTVISNSDFTLSFRGAQNYVFDSSSVSTLTITNDIICTDCVTATNIETNAVGSSELAATTVTGGTYGDSSNYAVFTVDGDGRLTAAGTIPVTTAADSLDFIHFEDSLELDANTVLSNSSFTLSFRGAQNYVFDSASISTLTLTNNLIGTGVVDASNIDDGGILAVDISADALGFTEVAASLTLDENIVISNSSFTLSFRGAQNYVFDSASIATLTLTNNLIGTNVIDSTNIDDGSITGTDVSDGSLLAADISVDSLDFDRFQDSLDLDAHTVLTTGGSTLTFRGAEAIVFDSANIATLTLTNILNGTGVINSTNILDGTILAVDISVDSLDFTQLADSLTLDSSTVISNGANTLSFRGAQNYVFDSASVNMLTVTNCTGCGGGVTPDSLTFTDFNDSMALDAHQIIDSSSFTLTFRGNSVVFDSASIATLTLTNNLIGTNVVDSTNIDDGSITSTDILDGTILAADISVDSLDFAQLQDSLDLDASTVVTTGGNTLTFRGAEAVVFDSATISTLTLTNVLNGTGVINSTNILDATILAADLSVDSLDFAQFEDSLDLDASTVISAGSNTLSFRGAQNYVFDSASISTLTITNNLIGTNVIDSTNIDDGSITSTDLLDGTILAADISIDSLDFAQLQDSLDLDASTVITTGGNTLAFRGAESIVFDSASIATLTLTNDLVCTSCITLTNLEGDSVNSSKIVDGSILAADISVDSLDFDRFQDSLDLDANTVLTTGGSTLTFRGAEAIVFDSASIATLTVTNPIVGTGIVNSTNILNGTILATDISSDSLDFTSFADSLILDANTVISSSDFTLSFRGANSFLFDSASISTLTLTNVLNGTGVINSTNILDGTILAADHSADSLNFTELADSITLDANTVLSNSSFTLSFRGAQNYVFDSASISTLTLTNNLIGTNVIDSTNIDDESITSSDILNGSILAVDVSSDSLDFTQLTDSLTLDANTVISNSDFTLSFRGAQNYVFDSASIATLTITNNLIGTNVIDSTNIDDGSITSTDILDATILATDISVDSLDFDRFQDSLDLDANTVISNGSNTLSFRGAQNYVFDSASVNMLTVTNCSGCGGGVTPDSLTFTDFNDSMALDANTVISNSDFTLSFRGAQNYQFDSALISTLTVTNNLIGTGIVDSTNIDDGGILAVDISADSLNFTQLSDSLALDAHTVISSSDFTLSFRGANSVVFDSANISTLTLTNVLNGTGVINSTNILDGTILAADISSDTLNFTALADSLTLDANTVISSSDFTLSFRGAQNYQFDSASVSMLTVTNCSGCGTAGADSLDFTHLEDSLELDAHTVLNSSDFTLSFRGANSVVFDSASVSTLTLTNVLNGTGVVNSTNILNGTIVSADISADTLDFTSLAESLVLDGNNVISNSDFTLSFRGAQNYVFDSASINQLTVTNCTGCATPAANSLDFTELKNSLILDANTVISNSSFTLTFRGAQNYVFDSGSIATLTLTNTIIGTGVVTSTNLLDGTIVAGDVSADSLDFASLADSATIDANTVISNGSNTLSFRGAQNYQFDSASVNMLTVTNCIGCGGGVTADSLDFTDFKDTLTLDAHQIIDSSSFTLTFRGNSVVFDSASISTLTLTNNLIGTNVIDSTNIDDGSITSTDILDATILATDISVDSLDFDRFQDSLDLDASTVITTGGNTLAFRGAESIVFDSASIATLTITNVLNGSGVINSTNILNGTIVAADVSADTLDFTSLADSLILDSNTVISNSDFTLSFRGAQNFVFDSASVATLTLTNNLIGTGIVDSTNIDDGGILAVDISADSLNFTQLADSLTLDANTVISNSDFTLSFRGAQNYVFDSASIATLTLTNNLIGTNVIDSTNIDDGSITSTDILDGTVLAADISVDSLDFAQFQDSLDLDAHTVLTTGGSTLTFRGAEAIVFDSANISTLTLTNVLNGTGVINSTNILDGTILAADLSVDSLDFDRFEDSLDLDASTVISNGANTLSFRGAQNYQFDSALISTLTVTNNLIGTGVVDSTNIDDGGILAVDISADSLDFTQLTASLTLDENTVLSNSSFTLSFRGPQYSVFDSASINFLNVTNCTGCGGTPGDDSLDFVQFEDTLNLDAHTIIDSSSFTLTFRGGNAIVFDSASVSTLTITNNLIGTDVINSTNIDDGGILAVDISVDSLDYDQFQDSMDLDAALVLTQGTSNVFTTFSGTTGPAQTFNSTGAVTAGQAAALGVNVTSATTTVDAVSISNSGTGDALQIDQRSSSSGFALNVNGKDSIFNSAQDGSTGGWSTSVHTLPQILQSQSSVVANGYVYVLGGDNGADQSLVYYAKLNSNGSTGGWSTSVYTLPKVLRNHTSVTNNSYLYVLGGFNSAAESTVYYTKLNSDGSIGNWNTNVYTLPQRLYKHTSVVANGYIYVLGGSSPTQSVSTVYYAKLNSDGSTGSWSTNARTIPQRQEDHTSVVANGYVYVIGGANTNTGDSYSTVYYAPLNPDGSVGAWTSNTNTLPGLINNHSSVVANGYLYVIGGSHNFTRDSRVFYAKLNGDGSTGSWSTNTFTLPQRLTDQSSVLANGYLYVMGGLNSSRQSTVYYASLARVSIAGDLDLLGQTSGALSDANGNGGSGTTGGSIYSGNIFSNGTLEVTGNSQFWNGLAVNGGLTLGGSSAADYGQLTLLGKSTTGNPSTCGVGSVYFNTTDAAFQGCTAANTWTRLDNTAITSAQITDGTLVAADLSVDSLDFAQFEDSLDLDASTVISAGANTLSFRGAQNYVFDSASVNMLTVTNCTGCGGGVTPDSLTFTDFNDSMALDANTVISSSDFTLSFRGAQNYVFDSASIATLTLTNNLIGTNVIDSTNIDDGGVLAVDISADSLNFTQLSDSLALDAHTVISSSDFTLSFRGANSVVFDSANISTLTLTNVLNGTGVINSTNILDGTILAADLSVDSLDFAQFEDSLDLDASTVISAGANTLSFRGAQNYVFDSASVNMLTVTNCTGCGGGVTPDSLTFTDFNDSMALDAHQIIDSSSFTLTFRGNSVVFDSASIATLTLTNNLIGTNVVDSTNIDDGSITSTDILDDTILSADVSADSLDFLDFEESLDLDVSTVISAGANTLSFRGAQNYQFDSALISTLTVTNPLVGTGIVNSTNILDATILAADVSVDSLDFDRFQDSLDLDAHTVLTTGGSTLTFRGAEAIVFDSANIATLTLTNTITGTGVITSTNVLNGTLLAADHSVDSLDFSELADSLTLDANTVISNGSNTLTFRGAQNYVFDSIDVNMLNVTNCTGCGGSVADDSLDFNKFEDTLDLDAGLTLNLSTFDAKVVNNNGTNFSFDTTGSTGSWSTSVYTLPLLRVRLSSVVNNGYVYALGGHDGSNYVSTVYYAKLNSDGSISAWSNNVFTIPGVARGFHSSVVANGYVYVIGGTAGSGYTSTVYYTKLNADGSTGSWSTSVHSLPERRGEHSSVMANGYVYVLGGHNGTGYTSTVYYAKLNSDGGTGAWSTNVFTIPGVGSGQHSSVVANGYVYVIGGTNGTAQSTVYYAKLNSDGSTGSWSSNAYTLPGISATPSSVVANGYVYVIGGTNGTAQSTVYYTKLNSDGSTGSWSNNNYTLPVTGLVSHSSVLANGYVYVIGGFDAASQAQSKVYYASLARTSIASGLEVTGNAQFWNNLVIRSTGNVTSGSDSATEGTVTLSATEGLQFAGTARPYKTLALNAEYAGATLTAFYGAGTDTNVSGSMTSDTDSSANSLRNYYLWNRSTATQHFYTVAVRVELPSDFDNWAPANAIEVDMLTESTTSTNSLLDIYIYNGDDTPGTAVTSTTNNVSASANVWKTVTIDDSSLITGAAPEWDGAGETAVIYLRMGSQSGNEVRVGDIRLNYLAKF